LESGESAVIVADRPEVAVEPGYRGRLALADVVGYRLEAFQRKIARAVLGPERECLILLPRGNAKTTLTALVALHHLLSTEGAKVYFVAASVPQARIAFEAAADFARRLGHDNVVFRHLELRWCEDPDEPTVFTRHMRVLGAEGPRLHGLSPTLMVLDELQAVTRTDIYPALASALHRAPNSKLVVISTAGSGVDSPLGTLRQRALGLRQVGHRGALTDARGPDLRMLEWAVPADANVSVMACAAACRSVVPAVVDSNMPSASFLPFSFVTSVPSSSARASKQSAISLSDRCRTLRSRDHGGRCRTPGVRPRLPRRPRFPHRRPTGPALLLWQGWTLKRCPTRSIHHRSSAWQSGREPTPARSPSLGSNPSPIARSHPLLVFYGGRSLRCRAAIESGKSLVLDPRVLLSHAGEHDERRAVTGSGPGRAVARPAT
jgi:hypothetical protein